MQAALASPPGVVAQWLLVLGTGVCAFFGDGSFLFQQSWTHHRYQRRDLDLYRCESAEFPQPGYGFRAATSGWSTWMARCSNGRRNSSWAMTRSYRRRCVMRLGRTAAITRLAPASFGSGASVALLGYHPSFVDVAGFQTAMSDSWLMTGDVADYYQGQSDGPVSRSNDQGYPYYGYRFENSPRKRRVEQGVPGKDYAIHDLLRTRGYRGTATDGADCLFCQSRL